MYLTWLNNNSWLIEMGGKRILLDPWLVGTLTFGNLPWLFRGTLSQPPPIPQNIDLILLSQGLEDHAHPPTLQQLDRTIPVVASPNAAQVAQKLGYTHVTALPHGESFTLQNTVKIAAVPGSSIGPTLVENGYLLTDLSRDIKLYYEPHGYHSPSLKNVAPVDVVIAPIVDLKLPLVGAVIKGSQSALQVAEWLQPQVLFPTAAGGDVVFDGLIMSILQTEGDVNQLQEQLKQQHLATKVLTPAPGERVEVEQY